VLERGTGDAMGDLTPWRSYRRWLREGQRCEDGGSRIDLEGPTCGTHLDEVAIDALSGGDEGRFHRSGMSPFLQVPAQVE
jgi:hypothetical protein